MKACKKYKQSPTIDADHHNNPEGSCASCVYFAQFNCRTHGHGMVDELY